MSTIVPQVEHSLLQSLPIDVLLNLPPHLLRVSGKKRWQWRLNVQWGRESALIVHTKRWQWRRVCDQMGAGCHRTVTERGCTLSLADSPADGLALIFLINEISCSTDTSEAAVGWHRISYTHYVSQSKIETASGRFWGGFCWIFAVPVLYGYTAIYTAPVGLIVLSS